MLLFLVARPLTAFFVPGDERVIEDGTEFIRIMALSFGLLGIQQVLNGVFNGAGFTKASMLISIFSLWVVRFPIAFILSSKTSMGVLGVWWAYPVSYVIATGVAFTYYKMGYWKVRTVLKRWKESRVD